MIFYVHDLGALNFNKMSETKFDSVNKERRSAACTMFYLCLTGGNKFIPPQPE